MDATVCDALSNVDVETFGGQMRRLSSELHELILQQCNLHTLKRIRLAAGKGYWQELSSRALFRQSTLRFQTNTYYEVEDIPETVLMGLVDVSLCVAEDSANDAIFEMLLQMPNLMTLHLTVLPAYEEFIDDFETEELPWERQEMLRCIDQISSLPCKPDIRYLETTSADINCIYPICVSLAMLTIHELKVKNSFFGDPDEEEDDAEIQEYSEDEGSDTPTRSGLPHRDQKRKTLRHDPSIAWGSPLQLPISRLHIEHSSHPLSKVLSHIVKKGNVYSLGLGEFHNISSLCAALHTVAPQLTYLSWQPRYHDYTLLTPCTWSSLREMYVSCSQDAMQLVQACCATLQSLRLDINIVKFGKPGFSGLQAALIAMYDAVVPCSNLQQLFLEALRMEPDSTHVGCNIALARLIKLANDNAITLRMTAQCFYRHTVTECHAFLLLISAHLQELTVLVDYDQSSQSGQSSQQVSSTANLILQLGRLTTLHLHDCPSGRRAASYPQEDPPFRLTSSLSFFSQQTVPMLTNVSVDFLTFDMSHLPDLTQLVSARRFPHLEFLEVSVGETPEGGEDTLTAAGRHRRSQLVQACYDLNVRFSFHWVVSL